MKLHAFIMLALTLSLSVASANEQTQWSCFSEDKSVSLVITHDEGAYVANGLVTVANIQVPMPCISNETHSSYTCLENNDQVERLGAVIGSAVEGEFSGYVIIHNRVNGIQKLADVTCPKTI